MKSVYDLQKKVRMRHKLVLQYLLYMVYSLCSMHHELAKDTLGIISIHSLFQVIDSCVIRDA